MATDLPRKILGIHDGHNSSVALMIDGRLVAAVQEERFSEIKNHGGFPYRAVDAVHQKFDISDLTQVVLAGRYNGGTRWSRGDILAQYRSASSAGATAREHLKRIPGLTSLVRSARGRDRIPKAASERFPVRPVSIDHHLAHASAAYYGLGDYANDVLAITCDGAGDGLCASVYHGRGGKLTKLTTIPESSSIGRVFSYMTFLFNMVPYEHEYKIMGLAPYCTDFDRIKSCAEEIGDLFEWIGNKPAWRYCGRSPSIQGAGRELQRIFLGYRFDVLSAGIQLFLENMLLGWIGRLIERHSIYHVALGGGVFMNIRANQRIASLNKLKSCFVFPSCGDESNCIGAAYWGAANLGDRVPQKLDNFYLWDEPLSVEQSQIEDLGMGMEGVDDADERVAALLSAGEVVGRVDGAMEFGARALGNRSILADPTVPGILRTINEMIKGRDFWMPFAPSVLSDDFERYFSSIEAVESYQFMMFGADSRIEERTNAGGALHPYDFTGRPHVVTESTNPSYYRLLRAFKRRTGRGIILNTSLNLHGLPMVRTSEQALRVMRDSGLKYLMIGNTLITDRRDKVLVRPALC